MTIHKSLGVTALVLFFPRVILRLTRKAPPYVPPLGALTHAAARVVHFALYALMILLPFTGYCTQAGKHDFYWFGLFPFPNFVATDEALEHATRTAHYFFALLVGAALIAHIGAACWHAWVKKDLVLNRMWPSFRPRDA